MRKFFVIFVCLLVVGCEVEDNDDDINYDSNWETLPAPVAPDTMIKHDDLYFVNAKTGWLVTRNGQIYNTSDGGESWGLQFEDDIYWRCVGFADEQTGWAGNKLGDDGKLLYQTNDGGESWTESSFGWHVNRIRFLSGQLGYASGQTVYKYFSD
jgi:photosystem II stability/assembly factor-like uncharacterized protein